MLRKRFMFQNLKRTMILWSDYSNTTDFYLKRETATNSLFWAIMGGFYPLLWSIFSDLLRNEEQKRAF